MIPKFIVSWFKIILETSTSDDSLNQVDCEMERIEKKLWEMVIVYLKTLSQTTQAYLEACNDWMWIHIGSIGLFWWNMFQAKHRSVGG